MRSTNYRSLTVEVCDRITRSDYLGIFSGIAGRELDRIFD
jgi:hypothetical protein